MKQNNQHTYHLSETEHKLLRSLAFDYMMFGIPSYRIQILLEKRLGRPISKRTILTLCQEADKNIQASDIWLDEFVRAKLVDHYKKRIDRMEYLEQKLLERFSEELEKPTNKYLTAIAHVIVEVDKTLSEYSLAAPMLAKIKALIPVDITNLNRPDREKQERIQKSSSKYLSEEDINKVFEHKADTGETTSSAEDDDKNRVF